MIEIALERKQRVRQCTEAHGAYVPRPTTGEFRSRAAQDKLGIQAAEPSAHLSLQSRGAAVASDPAQKLGRFTSTFSRTWASTGATSVSVTEQGSRMAAEMPRRPVPQP